MPGMGESAQQMPIDKMQIEQMKTEAVTPLIDLQDCYIECGCRVYNHLDGMPHQLAPHTLSLASDETAAAASNPIATAIRILSSRVYTFSPPPPRSI